MDKKEPSIDIIYTLRAKDANSDKYYQKVRIFAEVVHKEGGSFTSLIESYKTWLKSEQIETVRENEEYLLELLSFGVLWQAYGHIALKARYAPFSFMSELAEWRKTHQRIKPYIDILRGILVSLFLFPIAKYRTIPAPPPTLSQLDHVYKWFMATGEFREQALRFINWRKYWQTLTKAEVADIFSKIESYTLWFKTEAIAELGVYTTNVNTFIKEAQNKYRWREDRVQCMRSEAEYHLNMVGAELMNIAFRKDFTKTQIKAVLLPGCMRKIPFTYCKAIKVPGGLKCIGCTVDCKVNVIRKQGLKEQFTVYVIPHASDLTQWSPVKQKESLGVVASACLTTLVEGGWELKRYGVPAQCVLLDFCGCKKHWHPVGIETEVNLMELNRILN